MMIPRKIKSGFWAVLFLLAGSLAVPSQSFGLDKPFDHSVWEQFLKTYVNEQGDVDYELVLREPRLLDLYLETVRGLDYGYCRNEWPREEYRALLLNVYHAALIKMITRYYPVRSILDIPGGWDLPAIEFRDKGDQPVVFSLNALRQGEMMGSLGDEKIHMVVSLGAKDGPRLRREAFTGPRLEGQIFQAVREFVNDPRRVQIIAGDRKIKISRIFRWYGPDFKKRFGFYRKEDRFTPEENAVLAFLMFYLDDPTRAAYLDEKKYTITYFPFDWRLNDWRSSSADAF